jgi:hypothetical protein
MSYVWKLKEGQVQWYYWLLGLASTFALLIEPLVSTPSLDYDPEYSVCSPGIKILFVYILGFGGIFGAAWVMTIMSMKGDVNMYPTIALFVQNLLIFCSMFLLSSTRRAFNLSHTI